MQFSHKASFMQLVRSATIASTLNLVVPLTHTGSFSSGFSMILTLISMVVKTAASDACHNV